MGLVTSTVFENSYYATSGNLTKGLFTGSINVNFVAGKLQSLVSVRHVYSERTDNISMKIRVDLLVFIMECDLVYEELEGSFPCTT
jgi:hypothetical protein